MAIWPFSPNLRLCFRWAEEAKWDHHQATACWLWNLKVVLSSTHPHRTATSVVYYSVECSLYCHTHQSQRKHGRENRRRFQNPLILLPPKLTTLTIIPSNSIMATSPTPMDPLDVFWHEGMLKYETGTGVFDSGMDPGFLDVLEKHPKNSDRVKNMLSILKRGPISPYISWHPGTPALVPQLLSFHTQGTYPPVSVCFFLFVIKIVCLQTESGSVLFFGFVLFKAKKDDVFWMACLIH